MQESTLNYSGPVEHLTVAAAYWEPFTVPLPSGEDGILRVDGCMGKVIETLAEKLNFTHTIIVPDDQEWGRKLPNNSWSGMIGLLMQNKADLALGPFTVTYERNKVVEFATTLFVDSSSIISSYKTTTSQNILEKILSIDWRMAPGLLLILLLLPPFCWWFERNFKSSRYKATLMGGYYLDFMGAFLNKGMSHLPLRYSGRIVVGFYFLIILVVTNTIAGLIHTSLVVSGNLEKIDSLEDLYKSKKVCPIFFFGTAETEPFENSTRGIYHKIWKKALKCNSIVHPSAQIRGEHWPLIIKGIRSTIQQISGLKATADAICKRNPETNLHIAGQEFFSATNTIAFKRSLRSRLKTNINRIVMSLTESGIFHLWKAKDEGIECQCLERSNQYDCANLQPVDLDSLKNVFAILALGKTIAFVVLLVERVTMRCKRSVHGMKVCKN